MGLEVSVNSGLRVIASKPIHVRLNRGRYNIRYSPFRRGVRVEYRCIAEKELILAVIGAKAHLESGAFASNNDVLMANQSLGLVAFFFATDDSPAHCWLVFGCPEYS